MLSRSRFYCRNRRGVALLVVLAFISLMVILVLSFLATTTLDRKTTANYSQSIKAQEIGLAGLLEIVHDLKREIAAGSRPDGTPSGAVYTYTDSVTDESIPVYIPATNKSASPARIGFPASSFGVDIDSANSLLPPTLIRVSRDGSDSFYALPSTIDYPGSLPSARASLVKTSEASVNGRNISSTRWNQPQLLSPSGAAPTAFEKNPPQWIYMTRSGSRVCTDGEAKNGDLFLDTLGENDHAVLGRYAYVVYDEGALLDANVAGADAITAASASFRGKSYSSYADLTQIPGLNQNALNKLVEWRNQGGIGAWGGYANMVTGAGRLGFLTAFGPANTGPSATNATPLQATHNDNPFLSRQDLIDYCNKVIGSTVSLPYLGTFSRGVNAPSFCPANLPGSPSVYAKYGNGAETAGQANRNLANIRFTGTGVISVTHYRDDGTSENETAHGGQPLLQRRFSLAKLKWLGTAGSNGAAFDASIGTAQQKDAILACFGLTWNAKSWNTGASGPFSNGCPGWTYNHGSPSRILTFDEVAQANREPDFFELLKAAILNGSLGRDPGAMPPSGLKSAAGPYGQSFESYSNIPDSQIIQIGANIIDQADGDSYPTAIYFAKHALSKTWDWLYDTAFGDEDLPTLYRLYQIGYTHELTDTTNRSGKMGMWFQPQLWNPHQQPATAPSPAPTRFRISTHGKAYSHWQSKPAGDLFGTQTVSATVDYDADPVQGQVYFSTTFNGNTTNTAFRDQPLALTTDIGASSLHPLNQWDSGFNPDLWYPPTNKFVGICSGILEFTMDLTAPNVGRKLNLSTPVTFVLEYSPDNGVNYYPYNLVSRLFGEPSSVSSRSSSTPILSWPDNTTLPLIYYVRSDPRTDRFSVSEFYLNYLSSVTNAAGRQGMGAWLNATQEPNSTSTATIPTQYFQPANTSGFVYNTTALNFFDIGSFAVNVTTTAAGKSYYSDPDGIVRPGDGFRRNTTTGDGCFLFHTASATFSDALPPGTPSIVGIDTAQAARRPVVLNRPFFSVGELGYAFRDQPYKSLDFWSSYSGDAALLDVFSVQDEPPVVAGQINPNHAPVPVLKAMISGGAVKEIDSGVVYSTTDLTSIATTIAAYVSENSVINPILNGPLANRADLVIAGAANASAGASLSDKINAAFSASTAFGKAARANKAYGEAPVRALSSVTNLRTWNLLIDVIAQSGRIVPNAPGLSHFMVEGEKRYWLHIAIDRYTGRIVDEQLESVYE